MTVLVAGRCHASWLDCGLYSLFASSAVLLSNAKRVEIFAATAAYMAVLVVFVSNNQIQPT